MTGGRLIWQTPTGAILWELWSRRKWNFAYHVAGLVVSMLVVQWIHHDPSEVTKAVWVLLPVMLFIATFLDLLTCFGYIEANMQTLRIGFPGRLLLKPVTTMRLALAPMFGGGIAVVTVLWLWNKLILQPLSLESGVPPLWLGSVILSFFWWIQALSWSMPQFPARSLIMLFVAVAHLLIGLTPMLSGIPAAGRWSVLASMLLSAILFAVIGLRFVRRGAGEGRSWFANYWNHRKSARARTQSAPFGSAFRAQLWLEWRRQGTVLPSMSASVAFAIIPILFLIQKHLDVSHSDTDSGIEIVIITLCALMPIVLSTVVGSTMGRFDQLQTVGEPPVYIAVRPMTNGGFVIAKMASALAASIVTWVAMVLIACFWLMLLGTGNAFSKFSSLSPHGFWGSLIGGLPLLAWLILFTWKSLVAGMSAALTGRAWVAVIYAVWKVGCGLGLGVVFAACKLSEKFTPMLLSWLPLILIILLAAKISFSIAAFACGLRRKAITPGAVLWIVSCWIAAGFFTAGYAHYICVALQKADLWFMVAIGVFLVLPLADLAIAPLAMAWNRHR